MSIKYSRNLLLQSAGILVLSTAVAFAEDQVNDENVPDVEQGTVINADDAISAEIQAEMLPDPATAQAIRDWKLADYEGAAVHSAAGDDVGLVEQIVYDAEQVMYLIVSPFEADDPRVVPISNVTYDDSGQAFVLDTETSGSIDTMQPYDDTTASNYTEFSSDDELEEVFKFNLQGSSEINSN